MKEIINLGDQGPELEAWASNAPALHTITSRLPPSMVTEIHGTMRYGQPTLRLISAAIYKARMEALARSMSPAINKTRRMRLP